MKLVFTGNRQEWFPSPSPQITWEVLQYIFQKIEKSVYLREELVTTNLLVCLERSQGWYTWEVLFDLLEERCGSTWCCCVYLRKLEYFYWCTFTKLLEKRCENFTGDQKQLFLLERGLVGLSRFLSWGEKMIHVKCHFDKNCSQVNCSLCIWAVHK